MTETMENKQEVKAEPKLKTMDEVLVNRRIIRLDDTIDAKLASKICNQLIYLDSINRDPIHLVINSSGGSVTSGLAIIDTMSNIASKVLTHANGLVASMASVILTCGAVGGRTATENSFIMMHQPSGSISNRQMESDIVIYTQFLTTLKKRLAEIYVRNTKMSGKQVDAALDRDTWMTPDEALNLGHIDVVFRGERK